MSDWYVYCLESTQPAARTYVGASTDPHRRLRQHNGLIKGGARATRAHQPWEIRAVWGPYLDRSSAQKVERHVKKQYRGPNRWRWMPDISSDIRLALPLGGLTQQGTNHPLVPE